MLKKQDKVLNLVIKFIFCELFACIFMTAVSNSLIVSASTSSIVFSTILATLIFYIISCFKRVYRVFSISVFVALGLGIIAFVVLVLIGKLPSFGDLFQMLMDRALSTEELTAVQQLGVAYGIAIAISFLTVHFIHGKINLIVISLATFVFYGFQFATTENRASMGAFAALIYVVVVLALYKMFEFYESKSSTGFGYKRFAVFGIAGVMCICVAIASLVAPFEENAFSKRFSLERFSNDAFYDNGVGSYYLAWSGVGYDDSNLGSPRGALNFDKALKITSKKPVYIVASYCDIYTGRGWELSSAAIIDKKRYHEKGDDPYDEDKLPLNTELKMASFDKAELEYTKNPITLTYQGKMNFRTIFSTNGLTYIKNPHKRTLWYDPCDNLYTNQYMKNKFDYSFDSYYFDVNTVLDYLASEDYTGENPDPSKISTSELDSYESAIKARYTSVPMSTPDRVRELTEQIAEDSEAETQLDKVMSVMEYLYQFSYVYETKELADGVDFVDNFLFTEKEGYGTYFASAMTLMCRELGIPARYVKGFAPLDEAGKNKTVGNNVAHAWVEVYFNGFGWVTFEPSPYFAEKYYGINMNDYRENDIVFDENGEEQEVTDETDETVDENEQGSVTHSNKKQKSLFAKKLNIFGIKTNVGTVVIIGSSAFAVLLIALLFNLAIKRRKKQMARMHSFENRQFVFTAWYEIKRLARFDGNGAEADETPADFLKRLSEEYGNEIIFASAESFNKLLYSRKANITDDDRAYAAAAYDIINKTVKSRHKKFAFNFNRYILHRI